MGHSKDAPLPLSTTGGPNADVAPPARIVAVMNANSALGREVVQVLDDQGFDGELRLFGEELLSRGIATDAPSVSTNFVHFAGRELTIGPRTPERLRGVRVAYLGSDADLRHGASVVRPALVPDAGLVHPLVDPADTARFVHRLDAHRGTVLVPRAPVSVIGVLARALASRHVIATVLEPAGELGPNALTELYEQTMALFAHRSLPEVTFGGRLAFNVLPSRLPLSGAADLAQCPVTVTSFLVPAFGGTTLALTLDTAVPDDELEDLLEDAGVQLEDAVDPASILGDGGIRATIIANAGKPGPDGRRLVTIHAVVDEARRTAEAMVRVGEHLLR
jgi:hypothetical protein